MKRIFWLLTIIVTVTLFACSNKNENKPAQTSKQSNVILPGSNGGLDELLIIMPKPLHDKYKDTIKQLISVPYEVIITYEPKIQTSTIQMHNITSLIRRSRNILIVSSDETLEQVKNYFNEILLPEQFNALFNDYSKVDYIKNVWAKPQLIGLMNVGHWQNLPRYIEQHKQAVISKYANSDLSLYYNLTYVDGFNKSISEQLKARNQFDMKIPNGYVLAHNDGEFVWLRKDENKYTINIFIDVIKNPGAFSNQGITHRNKLGKFVETYLEDGSHMTSDETLGFVQRQVKIKTLDAWENRGLWKMTGGQAIMGGSFINYYIDYPGTNSAVFIEGNIYAPGERKKKQMRQLEVILSTFKPA